MAVSISKNEKGKWSDLVVTSIGACIALPEAKKSDPCIVIAYSTGGERSVSFVTMDLPSKNKLYTRDDLLQTIRSCEGVKNITYADAQGRPCNIYFCRENTGKIIDVVERDYENNSFCKGISEVYSSGLKFVIENSEQIVWKPGKKIEMTVSATTESRYCANTYEYAAVNAYNACLLGRVFEREELQLETKDGKRIKFEVRCETSQFLDDSVMYITPIFRGAESVVDYYETEEFNYIDGDDSYTRKYRITYTNRLNDYNLVRL